MQTFEIYLFKTTDTPAQSLLSWGSL